MASPETQKREKTSFTAFLQAKLRFQGCVITSLSAGRIHAAMESNFSIQPPDPECGLSKYGLASCADDDPNNRIVGGTAVPPGKHPWTAYIQVSKNWNWKGFGW